MEIIKLSMLCALVTITWSACVTKSDQFTIYPTVGELQEWDMINFIIGQDMTYKLDDEDQGQFQIKQPIEPVGNAIRHGAQVALVRGFKPLRQYANGVWLNNFIFMEQDATSVDIFYSSGYPYQTDQVPSFQNVINVQKDVTDLVCFDLDYITPTVFLVDCTQTIEGQIKNGFLIVKSDDEAYKNIIANDNSGGYKVVDARKIIINEFPQSKKKLLLRAEPAYASEFADLTKDPPVLDTNCELEVFRIINQIEPEETPILILKKSTLASMVGADPATFQFSLIDFSVEPNGDIYILDALNGIYVVTINAGLEWVFVKQIADPIHALAFAFDYNNLVLQDGTVEEHLVVVNQYSMNTYLNGELQNQYELKFTSSYYDTQVQMSQQYIVVRYKRDVFLYSSVDQRLVYSNAMEEAQTVLINPYEPDLVAVNEYSSHRYMLSNGFLRLMKQPAKTQFQETINVIGTEASGATCKVGIKWQVLDQGDSSIYDLEHIPLPNVAKYPASPIQIDLMASGPNLKYAPLVQNGDSVIINIRSVWNLKLNGIELPNAKDVEFSDILVTDNQQKFYLMLQLPTKEVLINQCNHNIFDQEQATCKQIAKFTMKVLLNKRQHSFAWWTDWNQIIYAYQENDYKISIMVNTGGETSEMDYISYSDENPDNKITSFIMLKNGIYVVQAAKNQVDIWRSTFPIQLIYSITPDVMRSQGLTGSFTPKRVFGNKKLKQQLIFIQTNDKVIMGDFAKVFTMLRIIDILQGSEVEVAISDKTFFVAQKSDTSETIDQYNYVHLQHIYKTQALPLYHFKFQEPLTVDYSAQSGWIFVRALDTKRQQTVILVYEPNVLNHVTLHKVLETEELIQDGSTFDMAVDGDTQMFLYFNDNKINTVLAILQDADLSFKPTQDSSQYVNKIRGGVQITNFPENKSKDIVKDLIILNTQSKVSVYQQILDQGNQIIAVQNTDTPQIFKLGNNWYHGQVTDFYVNCQQCVDHVLIQAPVYAMSDGSELKAYDISDAELFGQTTDIIYQTRDALLFTDSQGKFKQRVDLSAVKDATMTLDLVTTTTDAKYTFSSYVSHSGDCGILVTQCEQTNCKGLKQGYSKLTGVTYISKIGLIDNTFLVVLNQNIAHFKAQAEGNIIIYQFQNTSPDQFQFVNPKTVSKTTFATNSLYPADFDVIEFEIKGTRYYKMFVTDLENGLGFVDSYLDGTGTLQVSGHQLFSLKTFQNDQYYVTTDTNFYQVKVIEQTIDTQLKTKVLVTTSDQAQYVFQMNFKIDLPQTGIPIDSTSVTLLFVLTPYGDWAPIDKLAYNDGYVVIPYTDGTEVTLGVYKLPSSSAALPIAVPFISGIKTDFHSALPNDFALLLTKDSDKAYMWANVEYSTRDNEHLLIQYGIQDQPGLLINNGSLLTDQEITFHLENSFTSAQGKTKISTGTPDVPGKKSSNWWWITLIVVFGVAVLGAGGFFLYKKYKSNHVDPLLG